MKIRLKKKRTRNADDDLGNPCVLFVGVKTGLNFLKGVAPGRLSTFQQTTPYPSPEWEEGKKLG